MLHNKAMKETNKFNDERRDLINLSIKHNLCHNRFCGAIKISPCVSDRDDLINILIDMK